MQSLKLLTAPPWSDYELLDCGDGYRFERFGRYRLVRPDPQAIWGPLQPRSEWAGIDAAFKKTTGEKGEWEIRTEMPKQWSVQYGSLKAYCRLTPFKHTGIFPEQAAHWSWLSDRITQTNRPTTVLNLFGYTGLATLAAAAAGATVTHVDASGSAIGWARQNQSLSGLESRPIRWIKDDVLKFVEREVRRGRQYDGIIMDPPIYGHGPKGETWEFHRSLPQLMSACRQVLSAQPVFWLINAYAVSVSSLMLKNLLEDVVKPHKADMETGELAILIGQSDRYLSTGIFTRMVFK